MKLTSLHVFLGQTSLKLEVSKLLKLKDLDVANICNLDKLLSDLHS